MGSFAASVIQPFRRIADYRGRSRRTELVALYVASMALNALLLLLLGGPWLVPWEEKAANAAVGAALLAPTAPLLVRRLHDTGWSGWWAMLGLPFAVYELWRDAVVLSDPSGLTVPPEAPWWVAGPGLVVLIVLIVLLLGEGEPGPNAYGPDPREDEPGTAGEPQLP